MLYSLYFKITQCYKHVVEALGDKYEDCEEKAEKALPVTTWLPATNIGCYNLVLNNDVLASKHLFCMISTQS